MDSAVHAEDSSSANADFQLALQDIEWASVGVIRITPAEGPSFFVRADRLGDVSLLLQPGTLLDPANTETVLAEARVYLAEMCAMGYLARAEHCRSGLSLKLGRKGYGTAETVSALDWLESKGFLDDTRYAEAWVRSRSGRLAEGPSRIIAELLKRGVDRTTAMSAVKEHFSETDEEIVCRRAGEKLIRLGKKDAKLVSALTRKGFSSSIIRKCTQNRAE